MTRVIETISEIRRFVSAARQKGQKIGFVPTMGAFHEGHLSLIRKAREDTECVIASIFVNPLQFSTGEDYDRYPRRSDSDRKIAEGEDVSALFIPSVAEMYPKGFNSYVEEDELPAKLCGNFRPGHFRGVMTVVAKLFNMVRPDIAYFGQKDYQQYLILRRMAIDLNTQVDVRVLPIVREEDGVALSSRNIHLGPKQRRDALCLHQALRKAREMVNNGETSAAVVTSAMKKLIRKVKGSRIDYISVVNSESLEDLKEIKGKTLIALAVRIGKVRLIDNMIV